jgi:flagellar basal body-associated protein FliL
MKKQSIYVNKIFAIYLPPMKSLDEKYEGSSDDNKKQTQVHMVTIIITCSIAILVLGLLATPSMIYAQNKTSTPSNATTAEAHATNTTGTPLNTTSTVPKPTDS